MSCSFPLFLLSFPYSSTAPADTRQPGLGAHRCQREGPGRLDLIGAPYGRVEYGSKLGAKPTGTSFFFLYGFPLFPSSSLLFLPLLHDYDQTHHRRQPPARAASSASCAPPPGSGPSPSRTARRSCASLTSRSFICSWLSVKPGGRVVEAATGSLLVTLLRAQLGVKGHLCSYEFHEARHSNARWVLSLFLFSLAFFSCFFE